MPSIFTVDMNVNTETNQITLQQIKLFSDVKLHFHVKQKMLLWQKNPSPRVRGTCLAVYPAVYLSTLSQAHEHT